MVNCGIIDAMINRYLGALSIGLAVSVSVVNDGHEFSVSPMEISVRRLP